jgi:hypothetical protein
MKKNNIHYPRGSLLWEFGEEIALSSNKKRNHQLIMITMGTYKFYYINNAEIRGFLTA